jgi:hypothetical protein
MNNAERYDFADFTRENYVRLVRLARVAYAFRRFTDFSPQERFVLWRHDVDCSPQSAVQLAQREADEGIPATYFVSLHSDFYNLLERQVSDCIRTVMRLGHEIGLHFDCAYYPVREEQELIRGLSREKRVLEDIFESDCRVFSFHNPDATTDVFRGREYAGLINAAASYFYDDVGFCSDSNGYWRNRRLEDVLTEATDPRLQVLTHPEMWQDEVMSPRQRVYRCIDGRATATKTRYEQLLQANGRENVDWS